MISCFYIKHLVLSLVLSKPTKSGDSYYYHSANDMQAGDTSIKEQELSGWPGREVGFIRTDEARASAGC